MKCTFFCNLLYTCDWRWYTSEPCSWDDVQYVYVAYRSRACCKYQFSWCLLHRKHCKFLLWITNKCVNVASEYLCTGKHLKLDSSLLWTVQICCVYVAFDIIELAASHNYKNKLGLKPQTLLDIMTV